MKNVNDFKELVEYCAAEKPDGAVFQWLDGKDFKQKTYSEFKSDIEAFGTYLCYNGFKKSRVAVIGENSYEWILTYYTTVIGGNVIVPIDRDLPFDSIVNILKDSGAKLLIYTDHYNRIIDDIKKAAGVKAINISEISGLIDEGRRLLAKGKDKYLNINIDKDALSTIIYTSGTTGTPKGVMLNQYGIVQNAYAAAQNVKIRGTSMLVLPIHHTFGFTAGIVAVMFFCQPIAISKSLRTFVSDLGTFKPENMFVVPMFVEAMYKKVTKAVEDKKMTKVFNALIKTSNALRKIGIDRRRKLFSSVWEAFGGNLHTIISGGAPLDARYCRYFDDFGITLLNGYGITECSPILSVNCNSKNKFGSVGRILDNAEIRIIDEDENGNGEICARGSSVMMGYYNNKQATLEAFDGDWFKTGDLGYVDSENYLYVTGRQKNLIILDNGKNIYPEELEELVLRIPAAIEAVVYSENDVITAEIYTEDPAAVQLAVKSMNRGLPVYKRIRNLKFRSTEFEKTTTKKIKRNLIGASK
ncbi:MAG: AMP-binding protein [Candidatus Ornithomonoglobus sp.]